MQDFCFLDYHTEYSCEGDYTQEMETSACFSAIFNLKREKASINYTIIIYRGVNLAHEHRGSNACLLSKKQIENHIRQAQKIQPFKFYVKEEKYSVYDEECDIFKVHLQLNRVELAFHKYLLTWIRYTYEYPYNVLLCDTYKLKKEPCFMFTSIANLFNIVLSCSEVERGIHQISKIDSVNKFLKVSELRKKLKVISKLNDIYTVLKKSCNRIPEEVNKLSTTDIEYWNSSEIYNKYRKPVYLKTFKELKK